MAEQCIKRDTHTFFQKHVPVLDKIIAVVKGFRDQRDVKSCSLVEHALYVISVLTIEENVNIFLGDQDTRGIGIPEYIVTNNVIPSILMSLERDQRELLQIRSMVIIGFLTTYNQGSLIEQMVDKGLVDALNGFMLRRKGSWSRVNNYVRESIYWVSRNLAYHLNDSVEKTDILWEILKRGIQEENTDAIIDSLEGIRFLMPRARCRYKIRLVSEPEVIGSIFRVIEKKAKGKSDIFPVLVSTVCAIISEITYDSFIIGDSLKINTVENLWEKGLKEFLSNLRKSKNREHQCLYAEIVANIATESLEVLRSCYEVGFIQDMMSNWNNDPVELKRQKVMTVCDITYAASMRGVLDKIRPFGTKESILAISEAVSGYTDTETRFHFIRNISTILSNGDLTPDQYHSIELGELVTGIYMDTDQSEYSSQIERKIIEYYRKIESKVGNSEAFVQDFADEEIIWSPEAQIDYDEVENETNEFYSF